MFPPRKVPAKSSVKPMAWLQIVASAAPETPILNTKMNSGSSAMFTSAPVAMPIMLKKALPWKRICTLSTMEAIIHGAPIMIKRPYCTA